MVTYPVSWEDPELTDESELSYSSDEWGGITSSDWEECDRIFNLYKE